AAMIHVGDEFPLPCESHACHLGGINRISMPPCRTRARHEIEQSASPGKPGVTRRKAVRGKDRIRARKPDFSWVARDRGEAAAARCRSPVQDRLSLHAV